MELDDKKSLSIYICIYSFLGSIAVLGTLLLIFLKGYIIDENTNLLDMYIKASFTFFGSFFSVITSLSIFHLQNLKKQKENQEKKQKMLNLIKKFNYDNTKELKKIHSIISSEGISHFLTNLNKEKFEAEIKEIFFAIYTSINIDSASQLISRLDPSNECDLVILENYLRIQKISSLLNLFLEKTETKNGKEEIIKLIFELTEELT
ncbi:hypothetical protein [Enterococcus bulliens]